MLENNNTFVNESEILKKIDIIIERTNVSYRQAKEALDKNGGDLLKTLIDLEEAGKSCGNNGHNKTSWTEKFSVCFTKTINKAKALIHQGSVNKIRIKYDGKVLADIPILLGIIGVVVAPQLAVIGAILAMFNKFSIEVGHNMGKAEPTNKNDETEQIKFINATL